MTRTTALLAGGAVAALVIGTGAYVLWGGARDFAECGGGTVAGGAEIGGSFELTRHDGARVTEADVVDGLTLMYFGYTYCPDVCPIDTVRNADAAAALDERGIEVKPVMVSVDPGRDTPEVMADYVEWMHPRMVGLTGSEDEIAETARKFRVFYERGSGEDYLVSHTSYTYLMAPEHGFLTFFSRDASVEDMTETIACYAERI